jgi:hypothetical protein
MLKKAILYYSLLLFFCSFYQAIPGSGSNDRPNTLIARNQSSAILEFDHTYLTTFFSTQDATGKHFQTRYKAEKPKPKPVSDQHYISEKIKGNADRGPKHSLLVFSGEILDYIPQVRSFTRDLPFLVISFWSGSRTKIRPPPLF